MERNKYAKQKMNDSSSIYKPYLKNSICSQSREQETEIHRCNFLLLFQVNIRKYDWMPLLSSYPKSKSSNLSQESYVLTTKCSYTFFKKQILPSHPFPLVSQCHLLHLGWLSANKLWAKTQFQSHTDHLKNLTICFSWKGDVKMNISSILMKLQTNLSQPPLQSHIKGKVGRNLKNSMGKLLEEKKQLPQTIPFSGRK